MTRQWYQIEAYSDWWQPVGPHFNRLKDAQEELARWRKLSSLIRYRVVMVTETTMSEVMPDSGNGVSA
jgi:hypothetical protein